MLNNRPELLRTLWLALNRISQQTLFDAGRVYGGGLHKIEPHELANVSVKEIASLLPDFKKNPALQISLF
jgi:hypothetical protein